MSELHDIRGPDPAWHGSNVIGSIGDKEGMEVAKLLAGNSPTSPST